MDRPEDTTPAEVSLRARRSGYELVRLLVTVVSAAAGIGVSFARGLHGLGVIGTGIVAGIAGLAGGTAIAKLLFSDVADPILTFFRTRASARRRLALVLKTGHGYRPLRRAGPYLIGVDPSTAKEHSDRAMKRPPYIARRPIDQALAASLAALSDGGGVIVVRGHPKAGKSPDHV